MNIRKIFQIFTYAYLSLILFSCDNTSGPEAYVSGIVYSSSNRPVPNVKVTIGNRSEMTSSDGSFNIFNEQYPYDITVLDTMNRRATIFRDLSTNNISLPVESYYFNYNVTTIRVTLPTYYAQPDLSGKIIFTDGNKINVCTEIYSQTYEYYVNIQIDNTTTGKLIVLTYKKDSSNMITSYENYGESPDMTIQPNLTYYHTFDSLSMALNPGEEYVGGSLTFPPGYYNSYSGFSLSFTQNNNNNYFYYCNYSEIPVSGNTFRFYIPTGLPRQNQTILYMTGESDAGFSSEQFILTPGMSNILEIKAPPELVSPADQANNINDNTQFSFNGGAGNGVHVIKLRNVSRNSDYTIVTTDNNFTLQGLDQIGFGRINNNIFKWRVEKTGPLNSINDYVSDYSTDRIRYKATSRERTFSTTP